MDKMEYIAEVYSCLCSLEKFTVNGIEAQEDEFIEKGDEGAGYAEDYCCGNMQARPTFPEQKVLDKYKITLDEFKAIAEDVAEKLSFGSCGWCS